jgi:hypothetical protein
MRVIPMDNKTGCIKNDYCIDNPDHREYLKPKSHIWTCCGGIELHEDDKCPICGEEY